MAISKLRLDELIEQEAIIFDISSKKYIGKRQLNRLAGIDEDTLCWDNFDDGEISFIKDLYETKKEAKFALEFQNIERVEKLSLPTWEEFKVAKHFEFFDKYYYTVKIDIRTDILIWVSANNGTYLFQKPPTKENYLKACEICKQLFLKGEVK